MKTNQLNKLIKQARKRKARRVAVIPEVGIFWVLEKRLLIDSTPLTDAADYSDFKIHGADHYTVWEKYKRVDAVPRYLEYEDVPRGRVMYNTKTRQYLLLADRCILKRPGLVNRIKAKMGLPTNKTNIDSDAHYRCPKCLKKKSSQQS